ncbi:hypothetical protein [Prauserella cavernicola]|uniref:Uncharacterized protein n=1 Tax=Prauserella cavernicola TaxID=2800127 RepID=A0A934V2D8_9PSEU|nr:hypothetical protein [Prauserella cavernicola]MBK1785501.1 hypothetical protein [Prauserella cavernicola]
MPYPEERALEDVAFGRGLVPTRLFALLLPVWQVEVRATVTDGREYALIDRYVERGIAEAGLSSVPELARFFGLDEPVVDRALRFLAGVGHLTVQDGRFALTELGVRSLRENILYEVTREDRRKMYFEAFSSTPLSRQYYDAGVVSYLSLEEIAALPSYPRFLMLTNTQGFRRETLAELAGRKDRDRYNLPFQIDQPESLREDRVHLPIYLVSATDRRGHVRYLAYSQAAETADVDLSDLCERNREIHGVLQSESQAVLPEDHEKRIVEWLRSKELGDVRPTRTDQGGWRVSLPASVFGSRAMSLSRLGSFASLRTGVVTVWCADERTRERALLERMDRFVVPRAREGRANLGAWTERVARQLSLPFGTPEEVRDLAQRAGDDTLAVRLDELIHGNGARDTTGDL